MPHIYRYRKHIRWGQYYIPIIYTAIALVIIVFSVLLTLNLDPAFKFIALFVGGGFALLCLGMGGVAWYLNYKLAAVEVSIQDGAVVYKSRTGVTLLPLEEISCLEFPSVKYVGGWLRIVTPSNSIRLTVVIEGVDQFLLELKDGLDANGLSDVYDRGRFFQFLKTAAFSDQGWTRLYRIWWGLLLNALLSAAWGCLCALIADLGPGGLLLPTILSSTSLLLFTGAELYFGRYFANSTDEERFSYPVSDPVFENRIYLNAVMIWGGICLILLVSMMLVRLL